MRINWKKNLTDEQLKNLTASYKQRVKNGESLDSILPEAYADKLEMLWAWMLRNIETEDNPLHGFKDYELHRLDRDIAWMRSGQTIPNDTEKADFFRFFSEHDKRRNTDFLETFPEMRAWWNECEYYAKKS